jgi:hypothetical protein
MVARFRKHGSTLARGAVLALAAGAFVALSGVPAQAQVVYSYPYYGSPYYGNPYYYNYRAACDTFSFGVLSYSNCPYQPYTYYPAPYYGNYYAPYPHYYYGRPYYRRDGGRGR